MEHVTENTRGGRGTDFLSDLMDPHRARGTANLLAQALREGTIAGFGVGYEDMKAKAEGLANHENPRIRGAGLKLLMAMAYHDLRLVELAQETMGEKVPQQVEHRHFVVPPPRLLGEA